MYRLHQPATAANPNPEKLSQKSSSNAIDELDKKSKKWTNVCYYVVEKEATITGLEPNTQYAIKCRRLAWSDWGAPVVIRSGPSVPTAPQVDIIHTYLYKRMYFYMYACMYVCTVCMN